MRVLVTGATGAVGPSIVTALTADGVTVRILTRSRAREQRGSTQTEVAFGDINDGAAVARALEGVDVVHHLAGVAHQVGDDQELKDSFIRVNVDGTRTLAREAATAGVARVVIYSTIAVYGPSRSPEQIGRASCRERV